MKAVFIDTFYDKSSQTETDKFVEYTNQLITFASNTRYFECKDIKTALTELMEAQQKIKEYEDILNKKELKNNWFVSSTGKKAKHFFILSIFQPQTAW